MLHGIYSPQEILLLEWPHIRTARASPITGVCIRLSASSKLLGIYATNRAFFPRTGRIMFVHAFRFFSFSLKYLLVLRFE